MMTAEERKEAGENAKLVSFCDQIIEAAASIDKALTEQKGAAFVQRLHASLPRIHSSSTAADAAGATDSVQAVSGPVLGDGEKNHEEIKRVYETWAREVAFEYCDLSTDEEDTKAYRHAYSRDAIAIQGSSLPKRSLAIAKELAVLTTNIPIGLDGSVFLRVDDERVDIIKALITGPRDTPYENGCYIFDIFLPSSYNQSPPIVKTMTTNGGRFRLNPNLYAEGKVCLSLLGTWAGPGWISGQSSLLQVLISIQAMILNEEPYLNEPGWSGAAGTSASKAYSANVRRMVVADAILNNIKNPPYPFADTIRTHFRLKASIIREQLDRWLKEDDDMQTSGSNHGRYSPGGNSLKMHIEEIKVLLKKLERGEQLDHPPHNIGPPVAVEE